MDTTLLIVVIVAVVVIAIAAALAVKAQHRKQLRSRFGPEYDRTVEQEGSKRKAERQLHERAETRDQLHLRELTPAERERYREEWRGLQASFVDRPESSLADADRLVAAVMRDRGYPVDDFEQRAALISVDHPEVVQHYRAAHEIYDHSRGGEVSTEEQRRAVVHYRALFDELMITSDDGDGRLRDDHRDLDRERFDRDRAAERVEDRPPLR